MHYNLDDILKYTREIQIACNRTGVPAILPDKEKNWLFNKTYVEKSLNDLNQKPSKYAFEKYAQAVWFAAKWYQVLDEKSDEHTQFFNEHIKILKNGVRSFLPDTKIFSPQPQYTSDHLTPAAIIFFNSEAFKQLKAYKEILKNDKRNHFFGILVVKEKYQVLEELIKNLECQKSMDGIQTVLEHFYWETVSNGKSRYEILNTGQDIITFILGILGLKNTTTITLLNQLSELSDNINENPPNSNTLQTITC